MGKSSGKEKFIIGGLLLLAAMAYLVFSASKANTELYLSVDELYARGERVVGRNLRIFGAVAGNSIHYDADTNTLTFELAGIPADEAEIEAQGGLEEALHAAVLDSRRPRLTIHYDGPRPDLLRDEAPAIITGYLGEDGIFYASEILFKCPTKYEEAASLPSNEK